MIDKATKQHMKELKQFRQECMEIGRSTEPADFPKAEEAITKLFGEMDWKETITFHHCSSPKAAQELLKKDFGATAFVDTSFWGNFDIYWIGYLEFLSRLEGVETEDGHDDMLTYWRAIAESCGWWYVIDEKTCIICDRPEEIYLDEDGKLHNWEGMSVKYRDGYGIYTINGVALPKRKRYIFERPRDITKELINAESDNNIKEVMQLQFHRAWKLTVDWDWREQQKKQKKQKKQQKKQP